MATCPACGAACVATHLFCESCGARLGRDAATATPSAPAVGVAEGERPEYASVGRRALAMLLDLFPFVAFFCFALASAASRYGGWGPDGGYLLQPLPFLRAVGQALTAWLVYYACCEWWFGATLGKAALGIGVSSVAGKRANVLQALIRNALRVVDAFAFYLVGAVVALLSSRRQRLGDLAAQTVVTLRPRGTVVRAGVVLASLALPFASFGAAWSLGHIDAASNRWMSDAKTRLHGEGGYEERLAGSIDLKTGKSTLRSEREGYASGAVLNETLILDSVRFTATNGGSTGRGAAFRAGESAVVRFNLTGIERISGTSSGRIRTTVRVVGGSGEEIVPASGREDEVPAGPSRQVPRDAAFALPASCRAGEYHVEIEVQDLVAGRHLKASIPFTVR